MTTVLVHCDIREMINPSRGGDKCYLITDSHEVLQALAAVPAEHSGHHFKVHQKVTTVLDQLMGQLGFELIGASGTSSAWTERTTTGHLVWTLIKRPTQTSACPTYPLLVNLPKD